MPGGPAVAPSTRRWLGVARELNAGTATLPSNTIPQDARSYAPEDTPRFLPDDSIRGSMAMRYANILGPEDATFSFGSPAFLDTYGFLLDNAFGDLSTTGSSPANGTSLSGSVATLAIGGTQCTVGNATGYASASTVQIDSGNISEVVVLNAVAGTLLSFGNYPLRFPHASGATVTTVTGPYCVDAETEILTVRGWKTFDALREGEEVLTYNHVTGLSEWQQVQEVCVFPAKPRELILMEGKGHSSLTTPNHRWPVVNRNGGRLWKTTETLAMGNRVPLGAMCSDLPREAKYTDAFVELVGWFWTEGTVRPERTIRLCQSRKNIDNVERIDAAMRAVFGDPDERSIGRNDPRPRWRRYSDGPNERFVLNAAASALLLDVAPARVVSQDFLLSLTQAQLDLFIKVSMLGDNCGPTRLAQKNREAAESFQFAAILAGYATSLIKRVYKRDGYAMWGVTLQRRKWMNPADNARVAERRGTGWSTARVSHDGIVWCPRTPNMTWYARRNGHCYFTGNTHTFALLNSQLGYGGVIGAQPPTHTLTDNDNLNYAGSPGTNTSGARSYPSACVQTLDFTGNAEQLLSARVTGNSWLSAPATAAPTNTVSAVLPQAAWNSQVFIGGTAAGNLVTTIGDWAINVRRTLQVYFNTQGNSNPYIIGRGQLDITGSMNFTTPGDESPLYYMLNNTQPQVRIVLDNGLAGTSHLRLQFDCQVCSFTKSKPDSNAVLIGFQNQWEAVASSTNSGGSGGLGPGTFTMIDNIATF